MEEKRRLQFLSQIDLILDKIQGFLAERPGGVYKKSNIQQKIITLSRSIVERVSGTTSSYSKDIQQITAVRTIAEYKVHQAIGVVEALRLDLESGYLTNFEELIHGEIFGDFLEMARYLLNERFKDAAAVLAGSSLEAHLRQLCKKNNIDITVSTPKGDVKNKPASRMNEDLARESAYSKLDQKNVIGWLDLRNNAAHGKYDEYMHGQVALMVDGIRDFISRNPA